MPSSLDLTGRSPERRGNWQNSSDEVISPLQPNLKRRGHGNWLQPCLLTANCSRRTDVCIPEGLHPSQTTCCPRGTGAAPQLPFSLTACGPARGDLPLFSNIWPLSVLPCSCPCSLCSPSPYLPQPCSKMRFQRHLLHAVFLDLQCDVEQSLLWTSESPNLSFCPPLLGTSFILPPRWLSLLLKWTLSEDRGRVTDCTLYPQGYRSWCASTAGGREARAKMEAIASRSRGPRCPRFGPNISLPGEPHWDGGVKR